MIEPMTIRIMTMTIAKITVKNDATVGWMIEGY
jgi:hypothetical protein